MIVNNLATHVNDGQFDVFKYHAGHHIQMKGGKIW